MGQYYCPYLETTDGKKEAYYTYIDGEYMAAKLTEHSWLKNNFVNAIAEKLWLTPTKIAWIGDYAAGNTFRNKRKELVEAYEYTYKKEEDKRCVNQKRDLKSSEFSIEGTLLVNHSQKVYLDVDKYVLAVTKAITDDWVPHPLSLLVAQGNGLGGGDYHGHDNEFVGIWAFDLISIVPNFMTYKGYKEIKPVFYE